MTVIVKETEQSVHKELTVNKYPGFAGLRKKRLK